MFNLKLKEKEHENPKEENELYGGEKINVSVYLCSSRLFCLTAANSPRSSCRDRTSNGSSTMLVSNLSAVGTNS